MSTAMQLTTDNREVPMTTTERPDADCPNCGETAPEILYDDSGAYDAVETEPESAEACNYCYENDSCPARCNEPHDEPEPNRRGRWTCPTTGDEYVAVGDEYSPSWELKDNYTTESTLVHGEWYTDPYDYFNTCGDCGEWVHHEDSMYDEWGDNSYCSHCYHTRGHGGESADHSRYANCAACGKSVGHDNVVYLHPDTERTYCTEHAHDHGASIAVAA